MVFINASRIDSSTINNNINNSNNKNYLGREPWSSGYERRLTFQRSWVRIPARYTGWTWNFFTLICCKNCIDVCLKRPKINEKEAGVGPFFKKQQELPSYRWGSRYSSVDPTILLPRVPYQSTTSKLFQLIFELWWEKDENKQKEGQDRPIFQKTTLLFKGRKQVLYLRWKAWNLFDICRAQVSWGTPCLTFTLSRCLSPFPEEKC